MEEMMPEKNESILFTNEEIDRRFEEIIDRELLGTGDLNVQVVSPFGYGLMTTIPAEHFPDAPSCTYGTLTTPMAIPGKCALDDEEDY